MSKSSEVDGGGTAAAAAPTGSTDVSPEVVLVEKDRRGCGTRRLNPRTFRALSHMSSPLSKKGGTYESNNVYELRSGEVI